MGRLCMSLRGYRLLMGENDDECWITMWFCIFVKLSVALGKC